MKVYLLIAGALGLAGILIAAALTLSGTVPLPGSYKPNVLVVSTCSLRRQLLSFYGAPDNEIMPNLEHFYEESDFRFRNAVNGLSWTAIFGYTNVLMDPELLAEVGYHVFGRPMSRQLFRIPIKRIPEAGEVVNESDFEKDIGASMQKVREIILNPSNKPFFIVAHNKYLHYPLIDRFNKDSEWDYFLNAKERARIDDYLENPGKHYRKLPLLLLLANNPRHAWQHPKIKAQKRPNTDLSGRELTGLITNRELLKDWKLSEGYASDLVILQKIYRANARYLDKALGPMLNLYGDKKLQDNTIVIFSGDHGELHMERDELTHGRTLWDESLMVPMAVRFPGKEPLREVVTEQVNYNTAAKVLRQIVMGETSREEFKANLRRFHDDVVIGRDCANTIRGLRYANKYKYFTKLADGERFLFDLENDPKELNNLALAQPEKAAEFEAMYWKNFDRFSENDVYACTIKEIDEESESSDGGH